MNRCIPVGLRPEAGSFWLWGDMKPPSGNNSAGSALGKAVMVLEAILDQPQSIGLPDLADRLGMSRQSLHRLLQQLHEHGLIVKIPNRDRFAIGSRLSRLALGALHSVNQGAPIRATLQKIVSEIGETCHLGVLSGRDYAYVQRVECDRQPHIYIATGIQLPAYVTSGGKAMLAFLDDKSRARTVETMSLKPYTKHTITDPDALLVELDAIRERGYAIGNQEYSDGIIGVGVPVLDPDGRALAGLGMHGPAQRVTVADAPAYAKNLQAAAKRLAELWDL